MLYRIPQRVNDEIQQLAEQGDVETGTDRIIETIDAQCQTGSTECIVHAIRNTEAAATALENEAAYFAQKAERMREISKGLRSGMLAEIQEGLREPGQAGRFVVAERKSPVTVKVSCEPTELPGEYQRVTVAADKRKLARAVKDGETIKGVTTERGTHLSIRGTAPTTL